MTKEWIICIIIIILVISLNIITQNYTKQTVEQINKNLEELKEKLEEENPNKEELQENMENIMSEWKKRFNTLAYFIEHDELEKAETELTGLKANIEVEEYEQAVSELEKSIFILNNIEKTLSISVLIAFIY